MLYNSLKKIVKSSPILWKFLVWLKNRLIILSRLKDVLMMMMLFHVWPEQMYRFSTRKFLPSKKNRFSKESRLTIPYDLLINKSNNIPKMKEINVIGIGSSFDLNNIKDMDGPIFLLSFWSPLKIDNNGKIFYKHSFSYEKDAKGSVWELEEYLDEQSKSKNYTKKNITYVMGRIKVLEVLHKSDQNILSVVLYYKDKDDNLRPFPTDHTTSSLSKFFEGGRYKRISLVEKIYRPPLIAPYPFFAPTGSFLPILCALSHFAEKINVYGWDFYLESSPEKMTYWQLFFNMYKYRHDVLLSKNHFESALINFYYGYQFSKLPNINIHGNLGQLDKHEKLIKRIERVLFQ